MSRAYPPPAEGRVDEAFAPGGSLRAHYAPLLAALQATDLDELAGAVAAAAERDGVWHADHILHFDPVPRLVDAAEWSRLDAGLAQRLRALDAFVADAHGPRRAVQAGVVPDELIDSCAYLERDLLHAPAPAIRIGVYGPDVLRDAGGELVVLEDNVRTPTLMAYAAWARKAIAPRLAASGLPAPRDFAGPLHAALGGVLRAAAPEVDEPLIVVLDDGPDDMLGWEARALAGGLGLPHAGPADLALRGERLVMRDGGRPIDVIYRRTSEERLRDDAGALSWLGELLLQPLLAGTLRVVNAFGTGVADDKRTHAYVEALVRLFCEEDPILRSVPTLDLGRAEQRVEALERLDELVFKRRSGSGGHGLVIGPAATREERESLAREVAAAPGDWVAQELLRFSTHPTVVDGGLVPRHVDLRAFAFAGGEVLPGGLSRVALAEGDLVVNCSRGGGGKDTWVLPAP